MREPGQPPQFDRLIRDIERARAEWYSGNHRKAERILEVAASVAYAEVKERGENDPRPE